LFCAVLAEHDPEIGSRPGQQRLSNAPPPLVKRVCAVDLVFVPQPTLTFNVCDDPCDVKRQLRSRSAEESPRFLHLA